ncbi:MULTISPECIES: Flp family type IVb pilin [Halomonas]|uniref:Flp family type IVb pilin n=1 Tax=Halomonas TaxID=2745 RepID=UPI0011BF4605|nr:MULTISPECIES: Flp family type IVb pilin [Halomonas]MDR5888125.1 Flp family type IVb pilin [Halomonas salina]WJY08646.1 Flp family type IVb pilin [Halomonas halophila]
MKRFSLSSVFGKAHANLATRQLNRPVFRRQRGATAIEYAIIAAVLAIAIFAVFSASDGGFQTLLGNLFDRVESALTTTEGG